MPAAATYRKRPPFDFESALDRVAADPRGTPAALLRSAARLFAERGFEGVRTREVAAAAGVNVATLHFHWRDKATLYAAVQREIDRHVLGFLRDLEKEAVQKELTLDESIGRWLHWSIDFLARHPEFARLQLRWFLEGDTPGRPDDVARGVAGLRFVTSLLESRMPPGRAQDAALVVLLVAASGLVVFSDSLTQQALLGGSVLRDTDVRARIERFAGTLLTGLVGREDGA